MTSRQYRARVGTIGKQKTRLIEKKKTNQKLGFTRQKRFAGLLKII